MTVDSELDEGLDISNLPIKHPLKLFEKWYEEAIDCDEVKAVNTAVLSTASRSGKTSSRLMSIKGFGPCGFKITTNSNSLKAKNMEENACASLLFWWEPLGRTVKIDGRVKKMCDEDMDIIWKGFSREVQIMNTASHQDEVIGSPKEIFVRKEEIELAYGDSKEIPRCKAWVCYEVVPEVWQFHQKGKNFVYRIRFRYLRAGESPDEVLVHKGGENWVIELVSP